MVYEYGNSSVRNRYEKKLIKKEENNVYLKETLKKDAINTNTKINRETHDNSLSVGQYVAVFAIAFGVYLNTLYGDFLHDDNPAILRNPDVEGTNSLLSLFKNDFWGIQMVSNASHKSYRPICTLTFRFEHHLFGFNKFVFHFTNICLHAIVSVMFANFCNRVVFHLSKSSRNLSFVSAILFALHPIHTEAVANIVGRAELLSAFFYLLSLLSHIYSLEKSVNHNLDNFEDPKYNDKNRFVNKCNIFPGTQFQISLVLAACAMLSKETGITSLGVMIIMEFVCLRKAVINKKGATKLHVYRIIIIICWTMMLLCFRFTIMDWKRPIFATPDNPASQSKSFITRFLTYSYLSWVNFRLLIAPIHLLYDWSYATVPLVTSVFDARNLVTFLFGTSMFSIFVYAGFVIWKLGTIPSWCYGLVLLCVPYIPASNLFFPVGFVIAERTLYLPSMGYIILLVAFWQKAQDLFTQYHGVLKVILLAIMLLYGVRTWIRNYDWQTKETLFSSSVRTEPGNAKIRYNWGNYLRDTGRYKEAILEYEETLRLYPKYAGAMNNLATILEMNDSTSHRAEELYVKLIRLEPGRVDAYKNLAGLHMRKKRFDAAVDLYSRLFDELGTHVIHVISFAEFLYKNKLENQAGRLLERVLSQYCNVQNNKDVLKIISTNQDLKSPSLCISKEDELYSVYTLYAEIMAKKLSSEDLMTLLNESLTSKPNHPKTLIAIGWLKYSERDFLASEKLLLEATKVEREFIEEPWELAEIYYRNGELEKAVKLFEKLLEIHEDNNGIMLQYAIVLDENKQTNRAENILIKVINNDANCEYVGARLKLLEIRAKNPTTCLEDTQILLEDCLKLHSENIKIKNIIEEAMKFG